MSEKKTVIVTEMGGGERHYHADLWEPDEQYGLGIRRSSREDDPVVAVYAPGTWRSVRHGDALVPDSTARALAIAKRSLREILDKARATALDDPDGRAFLAELRQLADDTLGEIFAETDS